MSSVAQMGHAGTHFMIISFLLNIVISLKRPNIILIVADDLGKRKIVFVKKSVCSAVCIV